MASSSHQVPVPATAPPLLACEALGFSPQLLLDDIINIANKSIQDAVDAMEQFLEKWTNDRLANGKSKEDLDTVMSEVEQGLVAFQTLLEHHTDIAFDFFEAWSLRNIFVVPPDLPVVLPHQEGLDLTLGAEQEQELIDEVDELRKRLDGQRKLNRVLRKSIKTASFQLTRAESRYQAISALAPPSSSALDTMANLPPKLLEMYQVVASLPPLDVNPTADQAQLKSGKRQWETSKNGYVNWAVGRLLAKSDGSNTETGNIMPAQGHFAVGQVQSLTQGIGATGDFKHALEVVGEMKERLSAAKGPDISRHEDDSQMEE